MHERKYLEYLEYLRDLLLVKFSKDLSYLNIKLTARY